MANNYRTISWFSADHYSTLQTSGNQFYRTVDGNSYHNHTMADNGMKNKKIGTQTHKGVSKLLSFTRYITDASTVTGI